MQPLATLPQNPLNHDSSSNLLLSHPLLHTDPHHLPPQLLITTPQVIHDHQNLHKLLKNNYKTHKTLSLHLPNPQDDPQKPLKDQNIKQLKHIIQVSRTPKALKHLDLVLGTSVPSNLSCPLSKLRNLQNITSLDLKILSEKHRTPPNVALLAKSLARLKNLTDLSLQVPEFLHKFSQFFPTIFPGFKALGALSYLSISFPSNWNLTNALLKDLVLHISKLPKLKGLEIDLMKSYSITNQGLRYLSSIFKSIPSLSHVSIKSLNPQGSSASAINELFSGLIELKSLTKLHLSITPDYLANSPDYLDPISTNLGKLAADSLRELSIEFHQTFNDLSLSQLAQSLTKFSYLKSLSLNFSNILGISDNGVAQLALSLRTLNMLSSLTLIFSHNVQLSNAIEIIAQSLPSLNGLTALKVDFTGCKGDNRTSIQTLSAGLQNLTLLKSLALRFCSNDAVNDESIGFLIKGLRENITNLSLDLSQNEALTYKGIEIMASSLQSLTKLTNLTLILGDGNLQKQDNNQESERILKKIFQGLDFVQSINLSIKG